MTNPIKPNDHNDHKSATATTEHKNIGSKHAGNSSMNEAGKKNEWTNGSSSHSESTKKASSTNGSSSHEAGKKSGSDEKSTNNKW